MLTLWKEREPVYVRRRKLIMRGERRRRAGVRVRHVAGGGEEADGTDGGRKPARRAPVPAAPAPATAGAAPAAPAAPPEAAEQEKPSGDGNGRATEEDAAAAERRERRARNRARKKHGRS